MVEVKETVPLRVEWEINPLVSRVIVEPGGEAADQERGGHVRSLKSTKFALGWLSRYTAKRRAGTLGDGRL